MANDTKKIRVTGSLSGLFGLAFYIGQVVELEAKQAAEIVDVRFGEYVDDNEPLSDDVKAPVKAEKKAAANAKAAADTIKKVQAPVPVPKTDPADAAAKELSDLRDKAFALKIDVPAGATREDIKALIETAEANAKSLEDIKEKALSMGIQFNDAMTASDIQALIDGANPKLPI